MANWTQQRSGRWSTDASDPSSPWYGGGNPASGVPANLDNVTGLAGETLIFDVSLSSFTNGLASLNLAGAILEVDTAAGYYYLKMRGTINSSVAGAEIRCGSALAEYPIDCIFTIYMNGNYSIDCLNENLTLKLYCKRPIVDYAILLSASAKSITGIDVGLTTKVYCAAHGFSIGAIVYLHNIGGIPYLTNQFFEVETIETDWFTIMYQDSNLSVNSTGWGAYTGGGKVSPKQANTSGETVLTIDRDVSTDPVWATGCSIRLVNIDRSFAWEERALASKTPATIVLSSGLGAYKLSGCPVATITRNIKLYASSTITTNGIVYGGTGHYIDAEIKHGYGYCPSLKSLKSSTIKGSYGFNTSGGSSGNFVDSLELCTISSIVMGGAICINGGAGNVITQDCIIGMSTPLVNCKSLSFDGKIFGGGTNTSLFACTIRGEFIGGSSICFSSAQVLVLGAKITNFIYVLYSSNGVILSSALLAGNIADFAGINNFKGTRLWVPPIFYGYAGVISTGYDKLGFSQIRIDRYLGVAGAVRIWEYSGIIRNREGIEPEFPLGITYTYVPQYADGCPTFMEYPFYMVSGSKVRIQIYLQKTSNSWTQTPKFEVMKKLDDVNFGYAPLYSQTIPDDMAEHYYEAAITSDETGEYILRVSCKNTSGNLYCAASVVVISEELTILEQIRQSIEGNKILDDAANTLTIKKDDGITDHIVYDTKDGDGKPAHYQIKRFIKRA